MSEFVNDRDIFLEAQGNLNLDPRAGKDFRLDVDPVAFHVAADGTITPAVATFTATMVGFTATVLWSVTGGATLTASAPNVRTLAAANMPGMTVVVTGTTVYDGQTYIATRSIFKVADGKPGTAGTPADLSPASLLTALEGRITDSQLYADLRSKINLITDPVSQPGSVQAQVKAETDARVVAIGAEAQVRNDAIGQEVADRIAAVLAEAGARTTYVQQYTFSKAETNSSLSILANQIAAANTYTDTKTGAALSTAAADVRNYSYSKADTTSAISAAETRLRAEFVSGNGATEAYVQNWSYSKAQSDNAEATQTATLTTSYKGYADQKKTEAVLDAAADVRNYAYSKAAIDSSESAQSATLTTNYTAYADAARVSAVSTASADVRQYTYSKSTVDSAISSAIQQLRSEFVGSGGATEAYVTNYAYSKSQIDQAEALQQSTLTTGYTSAVNNAVKALPPAAANLITNSLPTSIAGYSAFAGGIGDGAWLCNFYESTQWSPRNRGAILIRAFGTPGSGSYIDLSIGIPVTARDRYEFSVALSVHRCVGTLRVAFYNSNGYITETAQVIQSPNVEGASYDTYAGDAFPRATVFVDVPANADRAVMAVRLAANGGSDCYVFSSEWYAGRASAGQTVGIKYTDFSPAAIANNIAAAQAAAIVASNAFVQQYAYSKSDAAGAFASMSSQITAAYQQAVSTSSADVRSYSVAKSELAGAIAQATSSLSTTVGQNKATIQNQSTSIGGLSTQQVFKSDINGYVTGIGLASSAAGATPTSEIILMADVVGFVLPGLTPKKLLTLGHVNGQSAMVLRGDLIADGDITARNLKIGTSDNIVPDPQFRDLAWWGRAGIATTGQWSDAGQITGWKGGASMYLGANAGIVETNTSAFQMTPGATYLIEVQVSISSDWNGRLGVYMLIAGVQWYPMIQGPAVAATGQTWANNGLPVGINANNPTKGLINCSSTYTVPGAGATYASTCIKTMSSFTVGSCEIGSVSITRVVDQTLIGPGSVLTKHLDIATGGDIHSGQQGFDAGDGFWLEGEGRGHGARMSIGRQFGRKIIMDPANDRLELVNPQLSSSMTASVSPSDFGLVRNANQQFTDVYAGNYTASAGNASGNLTYQWAVSSESSAVTANMDSPTSRQCVISVTGKLAVGQEVTVFVYCTVTDVDNRVARGGIATITLQTTSF